MSKLTMVNKIILPVDCVNRMMVFFREQGLKRLEAVALWAGVLDGDIFRVKSTIIPDQQSFNTEDGLLYSVDGDELHLINVWLYKNKMTLLAQIHTHPGAAYHSKTDDDYPIMATLGGLSIVIPDFADSPFNIDNCAVYRLDGQLEWKGLTTTEASTLIHLQ